MATSSTDNNSNNKDDFNRLLASNQIILQALRNDENSPSSDLYQRISCSSTNNKPPPLYIESDSTSIHGSCTYSQSIPLPSFLKEEANKAKLSTYTGLLSDANLAWLSIDDKVYIWNYSSGKDGNYINETNNDFCQFSSLSGQCIVSVGLVRPKAGIFKACVEWCLVVTTPEDAVLLAITFQNCIGVSVGTSTIQLHVTPFRMNTELTPLYPIRGTLNGRIFLGGQDGSLYEMEYIISDSSNDSALFGKAFDLIMLPFGNRSNGEKEPKRKCRKINHSLDNQMWIQRIVPTFVKSMASTLSGGSSSDPIMDMRVDDSRRLIYTLSSQGSITCYKYMSNNDDKSIVCLSVLPVPSLARQYLQCVIQSWISSPSSTSAQIQFAGSGKAISSNIHNVEGARKWLEAAQSKRKRDALYPMSIHIVNDYTSQFISLVAVTKLGLRYYFTYDCDSLLLCHMKSPPMNKEEGAFPFGYDSNTWTVSNSHWKDGVLLTALDGSHVHDHTEQSNNVLMTILPNCTLVQEEVDVSTPGAVISPPSHTSSSEVVLYPNVTSSSYALPGGSTWDISSSLEMTRDLLLRHLFHASTTPSDTDLNNISTLPSPAFLSSSTKIIADASTNGTLFSSAMYFVVETLKRKREDLFPIWTSMKQNESRYTFADSCLAEQWYFGKCTSVDIPKWMKSPYVSSFHPLTTQHLSLTSSPSYIVMNAGGIHTFEQQSIVLQFRKALRSNQIPKIHSFFHDYGFQEGCAMALYLALTSDTREGKQLALRAALSHANLPTLNDNFEFQPSSLHDALITLLSRLIRPFWLKPIVIVEHNQVHMLLNKELVHTLRKPLLSLQALMRQVFSPALQTVPNCPTQMDIDPVESTTTTFIMNAMQIQQSRDTLSTVQKNSIARYQEETSIHNLYRLLSKTVQFLNVFEMLLDHKHMVDWGLMHGIPCMQFVTSMEGHDRMQTLLLNMVTKEGGEETNKKLVHVLGQSAYLYFSLGDRYAYQGFDAVQHAKKDGGIIWKEHAGTFFCKAAKFWKSPSLVVGLTPQTQDLGNTATPTSSKEEQIALNHTSPLAKAAAALYSIQHYRGIVDLCLVTAVNFGGSLDGLSIQNDDMEEAVGPMDGVFSWETGLYHRSAVQVENQLVVHSDDTSTEPNLTISPADARSTCYSILFYYLHSLLLTSSTEAEKILNICVSANDSHFQQCLFKYLFEHTLIESLLRISSKSLEQYLIHKKEVMVLYRYYIIHNRDANAADVMVEYATTKDDLDLDCRTDCLSRAVMIIPPNSPILNQVKQTLENVKIQAAVLKRLSNMHPSGDEEEALKPLKNQLMDISTLLNEYTAPHQMFDICLRILNVHRVINREYTENLWNLMLGRCIPKKSRNTSVEELLRSELGDEDNYEIEGLFDDASSWVSSFQSQFIELGRDLYGNGADYTFPIGFLIRKLVVLQSAHEEVATVSSITSPIWLLRPFLEVRVSYEKILDALDDWFIALEQEVGSHKNRRMDCLNNIANILHHWVVTASSQSTNSSSIFDLSGENNTDAFSQLNQAIATGLIRKIQDWKTTLESIIGENVSNIHATIIDAELLLKSIC